MRTRYSLILLITLVTTLAFGLNRLSWAAPTTPIAGAWQLQWRGSDDLTAIAALGSQLAWAVGKNGHRLRTTNGGQTWSYQQATPAVDVEALAFVDNAAGWSVARTATSGARATAAPPGSARPPHPQPSAGRGLRRWPERLGGR
ncbi:MAG: hypothetical protein HZY76_08745 [Anaerolineae bacterium]|nr:MAG: hypothetical protein HZY76_08745 [Anaerolineae bacterium]